MKLNELSTLRLTLLARETREQSAGILCADPIAVVGMACRTPGNCDTPAKFWELLSSGAATDGEIPADRFDAATWHDPNPATPGRSVTRRGSFLDRIDLFDPDYFGILQREADQMDPQQRLALLVAVEALDNAGVPHGRIKGSRTGVYMACYHSDYARLVYENVEGLDTRTLTGTVHGVVANRISHFLDLRGPSLTLDTGCSSSLVAIHLACQSLRAGETDLCLAGGVSLMITPQLFVAMTKVGFMAPDGRCKTFEACADGFGRGEGCGVVALKRLSDAVADGDRVLGVIRSSVVNQDGHSTVLTAPNGKAQEAMIREALTSAAIAPERIVYVEAHGTGTELGDPIEVEAIAAVLGTPKVGAPDCFIGSAKANIGHLEASAGVVGLIKTVEVLRRRIVPPQPALTRLSPHISLAGTRLHIPLTPETLPPTGVLPCGAVSSFGIGGTNAHIVLEAPPELPGPEPVGENAAWVLPLSAKTWDGLRDLAEMWLELLAEPGEASIADFCHTAALRRTHYAERLAVAGRSKEELRSRLAESIGEIDCAKSSKSKPRVGFVFSGQGPQWWAMGRELMASEPAFREAMSECDAALHRECGWSVLEELARTEKETRISETFIAQPALFALQVSLARLWKKWGVAPAAVVGHSVGEIAALHVAGVLLLPEAARVVTSRGASMQAASGAGRMAAVEIDEVSAAEIAAEFPGRLDIAAVNAPRSVVFSGEPAALVEVTARLAAQGILVRDLKVPYAFHSEQMRPLAERFANELGKVENQRPNLRVFSTLTGAQLAAGDCDARYFADAIRKPVRFAAAIEAMFDEGIRSFVEIGPHPVLSTSIEETLLGREPTMAVHSLRRGHNETVEMRAALAGLYAAGVDPDWTTVQPGDGEVVSLPAYPWRLRRCWLPARTRKRAEETTLPWLGRPIELAASADRQTVVPVDFCALDDWSGDHKIFGEVVVPAVAVVLALASALAAADGTAGARLRDFEIREPVRIGAVGELWQIVLSSAGAATRVALWARSSGAAWRVVAEARTEVDAVRVHTARQAIANVEAPSSFVDVAAFYKSVAALGIGLGPAFQVLSRVTIRERVALATATVPSTLTSDMSPHPVLLDACLQLATIAARAQASEADAAYLPITFDRVTFSTIGKPETVLEIEAKLGARTETSIWADIIGRNAEGNIVVSFEGARFVRASVDAFRGAGASPNDVYNIEWTPAETLATALRTSAWIVLGNGGGAAASFSERAREAGARVMRADPDCDVIPAFLRALPNEFADAALACFWPLDFECKDDGVSASAKLLSLARSLAVEGDVSLALVTSGALMPRAGTDEATGRHGAATAAFFRVAAAENALLDMRIVDVDALSDARVQGRSALHALEATSRSEIVVRGVQILAARFRRSGEGETRGPYRVCQSSEGLSGVGTVAFQPGTPSAGELLVEVRAVGVNFRDTLVALGAYAGESVQFGAECAGFVRAVGAGVEGFAIGDRVVSFAQRCMATHAIVRAALSAHVPDGVPLDVAASLPVAYVTADIALNHVAGIKAGDRVLIHAATGGVGLALLALAQRAGAEIFATAGTPEKRAYLRRRGIVHVYDSRSTRFAGEIEAATGGRGVTVAINSLIGLLKEATLRVLALGGTFIELGKREAWSAQDVATLRPDLKYAVFDAGTIAEADPALFARPVGAVLNAIAAGDLAPLPIETHPLSDIRDVLQRMAQARHLGKIVLRVPAQARRSVSARADGAYLVTGGLGGIGLASTRWLVERGARHIWLVGRSSPGEATIREIAAIEKCGAQVRVATFDIADVELLSAFLTDIGAQGLTLRGIVHAAGVPGEAVVADIDVALLAAVRRGKVEGAIALRQLTRGLPLDFVVLCSSAAGRLGAVGQAAYSAANAELEMLAWQWRADGVPVSVVPWGPWADAGMFASASQQARAAWQARGVVPMSSQRALAGLERILAEEDAFAIVAQIEWSRARSTVAAPIDASPTQVTLVIEPMHGGSGRPDALAALRSQPASLLRRALVELLAASARRVLGLADHVAIDAASPLKNLGLDSLMAIELRNELARLGGVSLPATLVFDLPTLDALADRLAVVWSLAPSPAGRPATRSVSEPDELDELSEEDAEALLAVELDALAAVSSKSKVNI